MKKHSPLIKRLLSILSVFAVLMAFSVMGFSAAAEDHIVIAIHNTGREVHDNPLIPTTTTNTPRWWANRAWKRPAATRTPAEFGRM